MPTTLMLFDILSLLVFLVHNASALGITFTSPAAGSTWPAGPITVRWGDAGGTPDMTDLMSGTLVLVVGGNSADDSQVLQTIGTANTSIADGQLEGNIAANLAQSIQNGFYLMMTSNTTEGNTVINYSERFTLIDMSGTTNNQVLQGANQAAGSVSNVPAAQYNVIERPSQASTTPTESATLTNTASTVTATSTSSSTATSSPSLDGELSGTTLAGVIVGAALACVGAVSIVIWALFFYKRIKRKNENKKTQDEIRKSVFGKWDKAELPARRSEDGVPMAELSPAQDRCEAPAWEKAVEAPGSEPVFELEGDIALWEAGSGRRSKAYDPTAM